MIVKNCPEFKNGISSQFERANENQRQFKLKNSSRHTAVKLEATVYKGRGGLFRVIKETNKKQIKN